MWVGGAAADWTRGWPGGGRGVRDEGVSDKGSIQQWFI